MRDGVGTQLREDLQSASAMAATVSGVVNHSMPKKIGIGTHQRVLFEENARSSR